MLDLISWFSVKSQTFVASDNSRYFETFSAAKKWAVKNRALVYYVKSGKVAFDGRKKPR